LESVKGSASSSNESSPRLTTPEKEVSLDFSFPAELDAALDAPPLEFPEKEDLSAYILSTSLSPLSEPTSETGQELIYQMGDIEEVGPWKCYYQNPHIGDFMNNNQNQNHNPLTKHTDQTPSPSVPALSNQRPIYHHHHHYHCPYHSPSPTDSFTSPLTSSHQSHPILQYSPQHSPRNSMPKVTSELRTSSKTNNNNYNNKPANTLHPSYMPPNAVKNRTIQSPPLRMMDYMPPELDQVMASYQNHMNHRGVSSYASSYPTQQQQSSSLLNQGTPSQVYGSHIVKKPGHL
jgi:hypothetical protein